MTTPAVIEAHRGHVLALRFTRDGRTLVSAGMDNVVRLWSVPAWEPLRTFEGHTRSVNDVALSPDERTLVTASSDQTVRLWAFPEGRLLQMFQDRKRVVAAVRFSPDGKWVAAGSYGGRVAVWTVSGQVTFGVKTGARNVTSVAFSPDGGTLASSGLADDVVLWSLPVGESGGTLSGHRTAAWGLTFIAGGRVLASLGYERTLRLWNTETWQVLRVLELDEPGARGLAFSPDEGTVALAMEGRVQVRAVEDWTLRVTLPVGVKGVACVAYSPDGRWLAAGAADGRIRLWNVGRNEL